VTVAPAPDDIVSSHADAEANDRPPLLVVEPLVAFLDERGLGMGDVEATPVGEGHSNVTYLVRRGDRTVVLRRPPRPPLPPSAHDVLREARLVRALEGTAARVPRVLAVCDDESVIGAPFYVMEYLAGDVITSEVPSALDTPSTGGHAASRASASRPATSSARSAASSGSGSITARGTCPPWSASASG
jgi:hypothetical protein